MDGKILTQFIRNYNFTYGEICKTILDEIKFYY